MNKSYDSVMDNGSGGSQPKDGSSRPMPFRLSILEDLNAFAMTLSCPDPTEIPYIKKIEILVLA